MVLPLSHCTLRYYCTFLVVQLIVFSLRCDILLNENNICQRNEFCHGSKRKHIFPQNILMIGNKILKALKQYYANIENTMVQIYILIRLRLMLVLFLQINPTFISLWLFLYRKVLSTLGISMQSLTCLGKIYGAPVNMN